MKTLYVNYTPIPSQVPRQLAIQILHSHGEIITLNPLVLEYHPIKPPRDAPNDEYYSTWYEIIQRISFVPGMGKMGSGKVGFKGVFHDMPWGIQTHMYIPLGVDLRHKWEVKGNQVGEPPEARELGSKAPSSGLYLQENVEITCNPLAISFVKKELKAASKVMIDRMMKKAELLDAGVLQAMFEDGKLKTLNPNDLTTAYVPPSPNSGGIQYPASPDSAMRWRTQSVVSSASRASSYGTSSAPSTNPYGVPNPSGPGLAIEMLGDTHYAPEAPSNQTKSANRVSNFSDGVSDTPDPENSRFSMISSEDTQSHYSSNPSRPSSFHPSPNGEQRSVAELPVPGPYQHNPPRSPTLGVPNSSQTWQQRYNPQDYARYQGQGQNQGQGVRYS